MEEDGDPGQRQQGGLGKVLQALDVTIAAAGKLAKNRVTALRCANPRRPRACRRLGKRLLRRVIVRDFSSPRVTAWYTPALGTDRRQSLNRASTAAGCCERRGMGCRCRSRNPYAS
jgi:hypothetical protein